MYENYEVIAAKLQCKRNGKKDETIVRGREAEREV